MRFTVVRLAAAVVMVGAMLSTGSAAQADVTADSQPAVVAAGPHFTKIPVSGGVGTMSYDAVCFGYTGTFKDGSAILAVDWEDANPNIDECFGIAPGRTIWHAWKDSGGWKQMPNNGRADDMVEAYFLNGFRGVSVSVTSSGNIFCSTQNSVPAWGVWTRCN